MPWKGKKLSVTIGSDATTIGGLTTLDTVRITEGASEFWIEVDNTAGPALAGFEVAIKPHSDAAYHIIANSTSDFTNAIQEPILGCDKDMTVLPADTEGLIRMNVRGLYDVRFRARTGTASDATLDTKWGVR